MQCKLSWNGGASTYTFAVDEINILLHREKSINRTIDGSLKTYTKFEKRTWELKFKNITSTIVTNFKTIFDLDTSIIFYPNSTDAGTYYTVYWSNDYEFETPTNNSHQFTGIIHTGTMLLEEV